MKADRASIRRARRMRREANLPEKAAWATLRSLRARGVAVRRQHPIDRFIVDFAVIPERLVIEIDGAIHDCADVAERDAERQQALEALGWRVLRLSSDEALSEDLLIARVEAALGL